MKITEINKTETLLKFKVIQLWFCLLTRQQSFIMSQITKQK